MATWGPFKARIDRTINEAREWHEQSAARESVAARLDYYRNSLRIIAANPLGVGTGGFPKAYENVIRGTPSPATVNPHNEYLLITVQIGIVGLAALLWLLYTQWKLAPSLPTQLESRLARGLVIAFSIGCIFNSLLLDHTEGLFYAWLSAVLYGGLSRPGRAPTSA
jgi:O-antigen ligase